MATTADVPVHVVILAAGRGSRLGALGADSAKWLLRVGDRRIADRQVEAVRAFAADPGDRLASACVVTGHAAAGVEEFAARHGLSTLHNPEYLELNNWYSVLLAVEALPDDDRRVVVVNGDLCARPEWFRRFLVAAAETPCDSLVAVDFVRRLTDESMKVAGSDGSPPVLTEIGKVGVSAPVGEYVGMLMAGGSVRKAFTECLRGFLHAPDRGNEWYEGAVARTARAGTEWVLWATPDSEWCEIDDELDHAAAVALLGSS